MNRTIRTMTALALAALLMLCTPVALAQELDNGVTWDTTVDEMLAIEGVALENVLMVVEGDAFTQYGFLRLSPGYVGVAVYVYKAERLVMYGGNVSTSMQQQKVAFGDVYAAILATLVEERGEPTITDPQRAMDASNAVTAGSFTDEMLVSAAGWDLGEGAVLYHVHLKDGDEESVITMFVNETLLYTE